MEHDSRLNAWYSTIRITPNTLPMSVTPTTALTNENTMNYIAQDLKEKANAYKGFDIWQDLLMTTEMDSDNSTDHSAIYSDGDNLEDNEFDADYDIYLGEANLAPQLG